MNPIPLSWTIIVGIIALVAIGGQTLRLDHAQGQIKVFKEREAAQLREQQQRELANVKAKERADEAYRNARNRGASVVVRPQPSTIVAGKAPNAGGDSRATTCVLRGELDDALADFAQWHSAELTRLLARVSQLDARAATDVARKGEVLAAAYQACRAFALEEQ